jgi:hypothetical protein
VAVPGLGLVPWFFAGGLLLTKGFSCCKQRSVENSRGFMSEVLLMTFG